MASDKLQALRITQAFPISVDFGDPVFSLPYPGAISQGVFSGTNIFVYSDDTADFIKDGVSPGDIVSQEFNYTSAIVVRVISSTSLELSSSVIAVGDYQINKPVGNEGCLLYVAYGGGVLPMKTVGGDQVVLENIPSGIFVPILVTEADIFNLYGVYVLI